MKKISALFPIILSILFAFLGYYLYFEKSTQVDNSILYKVVGAICMVFFGVSAILGLKKLFSK